MPKHETKYRPYFTVHDLNVLQHANSIVNGPEHPLSRYLNKYIRDIEDAFIKPSHTTNPRPTLEEKLFPLPETVTMETTNDSQPELNEEDLDALNKQFFSPEN
jgi:hypothetical protein